MGKSSKNQGCNRAGSPIEGILGLFGGAADPVKTIFPRTMARSCAQSQALPWPEGHMA
jgi:hypothetical protein